MIVNSNYIRTCLNGLIQQDNEQDDESSLGDREIPKDATVKGLN